MKGFTKSKRIEVLEATTNKEAALIIE